MAASAAAGEMSDPASETSISETVYEEPAEVFGFVFALPGCATGLCPTVAGRGCAAGAGALETSGSGFLSKIATGACEQG